MGEVLVSRVSQLCHLTLARSYIPLNLNKKRDSLLVVKTQSYDRLTAEDFPDMSDNRNVHSLFAWPLSVKGRSRNKCTSHQSLPYLDLQGKILAS